jgi:prepilin-type N-terminal cleavage/methylation domain-containing protein
MPCFLRLYINFKNFKNTKGFTLIEILIVISLLGLLSVVAMPAFRNFSENQRLDEVGNDLFRAVKETQSMGINGIRCITNNENPSNPNSKLTYPEGWIIRIGRNNPSYSIYGYCRENPFNNPSSQPETIFNISYKEQDNSASGISSTYTGCEDTGPPGLRRIEIMFGRKEIGIRCNYQPTGSGHPEEKFNAITGDIRIDMTRNEETRTITITPSGVITYK